LAQTLRDRIEFAVAQDYIDRWIDEIERDFCKPELSAVLESVAPDGALIDHFDGRMLNPGHAIEAAWFIMHEARVRGGDARLLSLGVRMLDWMWDRCWDREHGGIYYFRDLHDKPCPEYWHDMKFWWPHNEAIIATLLAHVMTGEQRHLERFQLVHEWAQQHFADPEHGEWFGYLHRDGTRSVDLKGNHWKGPFHVPRMQWYCWQLLEEHIDA
jgi:N-acylglucosamine 2-epimerase